MFKTDVHKPMSDASCFTPYVVYEVNKKVHFFART